MPGNRRKYLSDTMEQVRMPISELKSYIESKIEF